MMTDSSFLWKATAFSVLTISISACSSGSKSPKFSASPDTYSVSEGGLIERSADAGVLSNDTLDASLSSQVSLLTNTIHGQLSLNANGSFSYQHNGSEGTSDQFTYQVVQGASTYTSSVSLTINPVDDPPQATPSICVTVANNATSANAQLSASDPDSDNNQITYSFSASDTNATIGTSDFGAEVIIDKTSGNLSYRLNGAKRRGADSFTYYAHSNGKASAAASVQVISRARIMPLGDSITEGVLSSGQPAYPQRAGYRRQLLQRLNDTGYTFDFVGSRNYGNALLSDADNEGHGGFNPIELRTGANKPDPDGNGPETADNYPGIFQALESNPADIILLHAGTNPSPSGFQPNEVTNLANAINNWETQGSNGVPTTVLLATIVRSENNPNPGVHPALNASSFNTTLRFLADRDDINLVEMENLLRQPSDFGADSIHPNTSGYNKMGDRWFEALTGEGGPLKKCD